MCAERRRRTWSRGRRERSGRGRRQGLNNNTTQKERQSVLRERTRKAPGRNIESARMRRKSRSAVEINTESPNRAKKKLIGKGPHKIRQRADLERTRKRARLRLGFSAEFRNIGQKGITTRKRHTSSHSLELANTPSSHQGYEKQNLASKVPERTGGKRFKGRTPKQR